MIRTISAAALLAAVSAFLPQSAQAYATSPWCAVVNTGVGDMHWDCHYQTVEQCIPHVLAGNRGFCNENPNFTGPSRPTRRAYRRHGASRS